MSLVIQVPEAEEARTWALLQQQTTGLAEPKRAFVIPEAAATVLRRAGIDFVVLSGTEGTEDAVAARQEFQRLADQWRAERGFTSRAAHMAEHPAYRRIVTMGVTAVPFLLAELERQPDHWFIALHEITGANPVPEPHHGKLPEMAAAWIRWGREHGYSW
jgi:hypothetical protein